MVRKITVSSVEGTGCRIKGWLLTSLFSILLATLSPHSYAADNWHTSKITHVYALATGGFVLRFTDDDPACTNTNDPRYFHVIDGENGMTIDGLNKIYSAALAAAAQGNAVTINFDDSEPQCYINRLWINF